MSDLKENLRGGMIYSIYCPKCNRCDGRYGGNDYRYGSPLRTCPKCGTHFINRFYHEIEIEGVSPIAFDAKRTLFGMAVTAAIFLVGASVHWYEITFQDYYHTAPIFIMAVSAIAFIYSIFDIIMIKSGIKDRRTQKKREESAARLSDPQYALKLSELGYNVPEKYLRNEEKIQ